MKVTKRVDNVDELIANIKALTRAQVLVGVPESNATRRNGPITNASLAYIHEFGSPARNIPARPFLFPGIAKAKTRITALLMSGARAALGKTPRDVFVILEKVGMVARNSVVREIRNPDPAFAPLKPGTIRGRLRRTAAGRRKLKTLKGAARQQALDPSNFKPLIDTGQLRASITYVVRSR